mmetsp:Transcript_26620/g.87276  ORF Transcript_26620/g.87276 Transcript_26620/m.87276 type:complete len:594 (-) Transcript_26620:1506-3287(-)
MKTKAIKSSWLDAEPFVLFGFGADDHDGALHFADELDDVGREGVGDGRGRDEEVALGLLDDVGDAVKGSLGREALARRKPERHELVLEPVEHHAGVVLGDGGGGEQHLVLPRAHELRNERNGVDRDGLHVERELHLRRVSLRAPARVALEDEGGTPDGVGDGDGDGGERGGFRECFAPEDDHRRLPLRHERGDRLRHRPHLRDHLFGARDVAVREHKLVKELRPFRDVFAAVHHRHEDEAVDAGEEHALDERERLFAALELAVLGAAHDDGVPRLDPFAPQRQVDVLRLAHPRLESHVAVLLHHDQRHLLPRVPLELEQRRARGDHDRSRLGRARDVRHVEVRVERGGGAEHLGSQRARPPVLHLVNLLEREGGAEAVRLEEALERVEVEDVAVDRGEEPGEPVRDGFPAQVGEHCLAVGACYRQVLHLARKGLVSVARSEDDAPARANLVRARRFALETHLAPRLELQLEGVRHRVDVEHVLAQPVHVVDAVAREVLDAVVLEQIDGGARQVHHAPVRVDPVRLPSPRQLLKRVPRAVQDGRRRVVKLKDARLLVVHETRKRGLPDQEDVLTREPVAAIRHEVGEHVRLNLG